MVKRFSAVEKHIYVIIAHSSVISRLGVEFINRQLESHNQHSVFPLFLFSDDLQALDVHLFPEQYFCELPDPYAGINLAARTSAIINLLLSLGAESVVTLGPGDYLSAGCDTLLIETRLAGGPPKVSIAREFDGGMLGLIERNSAIKVSQRYANLTVAANQGHRDFLRRWTVIGESIKGSWITDRVALNLALWEIESHDNFILSGVACC